MAQVVIPLLVMSGELVWAIRVFGQHTIPILAKAKALQIRTTHWRGLPFLLHFHRQHLLLPHSMPFKPLGYNHYHHIPQQVPRKLKHPPNLLLLVTNPSQVRPRFQVSIPGSHTQPQGPPIISPPLLPMSSTMSYILQVQKTGQFT